MGAGGVLLIIAAYIFTGAFFGLLCWKKFVDETDLDDGAGPACFFSGVFWPVGMLIWGAFFAVERLLKEVK